MRARPTLDLEQERRAAEALRDTLAKLPGMDDETVRDVIEGETGLHDAIAGVVALLTETEIMKTGLEAKAKELGARLKRYQDRLDFLRAALEQAMVIGALPALEMPDCTLSLSRRQAGVVITDEAKIPAAYWKQPDPVLDKAALKEALKDKKEIPGAVLGGESVSLTIRRL